MKALRGMKDIAFEEAKKYLYFLDIASNIAKNYGFSYVETPILEETSLFKRSVGNSSDIVNKEMYQFIDKGGHDVCLRPEGTAGVVRFFISNKLDRVQQKYKFFYYGPMFRYERPQKGRFREFHQFGCESFGEASVLEDYTIIEMIDAILKKLNIAYTLEINSLGCNECMPSYKERLVNFLEDKKEKLCQDCQRRITTNPIRTLDCKNNDCKTILQEAPKLPEYLCNNCKKDFELLQKLLKENNITFTINPKLVRGLDYYNKSAFEFVSNELGAQGAIAGGGRYDKLVEYLGGRATPAVGFAIGIERIIDLIKLPNEPREGFYFGAMNDEGVEKLLPLVKEIRKNKKAILEYTPKKLKAHLKAADKVNAKYCVFIGEDELQNDTLWLKDLEQKEEKILTTQEFLQMLK